jgi:hypothetical protein
MAVAGRLAWPPAGQAPGAATTEPRAAARPLGRPGRGRPGPGLLRRRLRHRITLLTINLEVRPGLHGAAFVAALHQLLPALGAYALSFLILGQLWLAHHRIFGVIARVDYVVLRSNLLFLGLIALMPFPVRLLSDYSDRPLAVAVYAVAFIAAMVLQLVIWLDVTRPSAGTCSARRSPTRSAPASAGCWAGWW